MGMLKHAKKYLLYIILIPVVIGSLIVWGYHVFRAKHRTEAQPWTVTYKYLGTLSSPRLADLNDDDVLDVIMGAGTVEFHTSDSAIIAIDGATGQLLWTARARDQIFGSPIFKDITGDGRMDVFIGGRAAEMKAINGRNGKIIWEYYPHQVNITKSDSGAYNFYSPQFIPDQDEDGLEDLIVAAGGYVKALPHDPKRPAGKLLVLSSASGARLASADMPDGKEIYMSVVLADFKGDGGLSVIFGTGGETLGGGLYKAPLTALLKNDLSDSKLLVTGQEKGFIAPPVLADITGDGVPDIVANAVNGRMFAIDGAREEVLWSVSIPGTEAYCSIAAGYYTDDDVPDFFTNYGIGIWPDLNRSVQFMVNGKTGQIAFRDSLGTFQESSPVTCDYNQDGYDDALFSVNNQRTSGYDNELMVIDFHNDTIYRIGPPQYGANVASTPWVGDMDQDGYLDIVHCNEMNPFDLLSVTYKEGLKISKQKTRIPIQEPLSWGAYMGSYYDGVFRLRKRGNK
jgi:outer membrane protein assembly factor BamB